MNIIENSTVQKELKANVLHFTGELLWSVFKEQDKSKVYLEKAIELLKEEIEDNYLLEDK